MAALLTYHDRLHVLTAPSDMVPLDPISPEDVERVLKMAAANFDYVVVDMPAALVQWTEAVLNHAHVYFCTLEVDMRSLRTPRVGKALQSEDLPSRSAAAINRGPKMMDVTGKARIGKMAEPQYLDRYPASRRRQAGGTGL